MTKARLQVEGRSLRLNLKCDGFRQVNDTNEWLQLWLSAQTSRWNWSGAQLHRGPTAKTGHRSMTMMMGIDGVITSSNRSAFFGEMTSERRGLISLCEMEKRIKHLKCVWHYFYFQLPILKKKKKWKSLQKNARMCHSCCRYRVATFGLYEQIYRLKRKAKQRNRGFYRLQPLDDISFRFDEGLCLSARVVKTENNERIFFFLNER